MNMRSRVVTVLYFTAWVAIVAAACGGCSQVKSLIGGSTLDAAAVSQNKKNVDDITTLNETYLNRVGVPTIDTENKPVFSTVQSLKDAQHAQNQGAIDLANKILESVK